jgi:hypothetical protein
MCTHVGIKILVSLLYQDAEIINTKLDTFNHNAC